MLRPNPPEGYSGFLELNTPILFLDETDIKTPFSESGVAVIANQVGVVAPVPAMVAVGAPVPIPKPAKPRTEEEILDSLFNDDEIETATPAKKEQIRIVRSRNLKAVKNLKDLYGGKCQVSGEILTFKKKDGAYYCEAHHLIPLGKEGADDPHNIIVISPLVHRMLHYADVSEIDLSKIAADNTLEITINGKKHKITWHQKHCDLIRKAQAEKE